MSLSARAQRELTSSKRAIADASARSVRAETGALEEDTERSSLDMLLAAVLRVRSRNPQSTSAASTTDKDILRGRNNTGNK